MTPQERDWLVDRLLAGLREGHPMRLVLLSGNIVGGENSVIVFFNKPWLTVRLANFKPPVEGDLAEIISYSDVLISKIDYIDDFVKK